jgi:hypothetical protein
MDSYVVNIIFEAGDNELHGPFATRPQAEQYRDLVADKLKGDGYKAQAGVRTLYAPFPFPSRVK